jgi:agmatinase
MTERVEIGQMFGAPPPDTFLGLPAAAPDAVEGGVAILGADTATPYASVGPYCAGGPAAMRRAIGQYAANLAHHDFDVDGRLLPPGARAVDCGDVPVGADAAANRGAIRDACGAILDRGAVPILLGGDDSVPIPLIEALAARGPFAILQLDAHIDWRDDVGGERFGLSSTMRRASELHGVGPIVQVGQRAIGSARPGDRDDAIAAGVTLVPAREVHRDGLGRAIAAIPEGARVLVALDVDGLDPSICPAVLGPAPGGLLYWHVLELLDAVARRGTLAAMDVVELVPGRDPDGLSALTAARIVAYAMAVAARQGAA